MVVEKILQEKQKKVISVYVTAGYPSPDDTPGIIRSLANLGVDLIELGIPYSDPLADGPVIQQSNAAALAQGQTIARAFEQVREARKYTDIPIILMGYVNPFIQYGAASFLKDAAEAGVQGLLLPDLPMDIYEREYQAMFRAFGIETSFLVTPETTPERIKKAVSLSDAFLYVVSGYAITGGDTPFDERQLAYFERIQRVTTDVPSLLGFGISNQRSLEQACYYFDGAIVGSAFIRLLGNSDSTDVAVDKFRGQFGL